MPVQVTYPGVYIEEIPSGEYVITGVATSITAFVGRAVCGPTDEPITIFSFGDYERMFGGLSYSYPMSYSVRDFFLNGGTQAIIARLFQPDTELSKDQWMKTANQAASAVIKAVSKMKVTNDTKPQEVVKTASDAAAQYTAGPAQSTAQAVVTLVKQAAQKTGAKAQDVKNSVDQIDATTLVPPFPSPIASLKLGAFDWASVLEAVSSVIKAAVDSMFGPDGSPLTIPNLANKVYKDTRFKVQQLSGSNDYLVSKYARSLNLKFQAPAKNDSEKDVIDKCLDDVTTVAKQFVPQSTYSQIDSYKNSLKTLDGLFDQTGSLKSGTSQKGIDGDLSNAYQKLSNAAAVSSGSVLQLTAANPGSWGNRLTASVDYEGITHEVAESYKEYGLKITDLFNMNVEYTKPDGQKMIERFTNVTVKKDTGAPNRLDRVLLHQSQLVLVPTVDEDGEESPNLPDNPPPDQAVGHGQGGSDGSFLDPLTYIGDEDQKTGIYMLKKVDLFNLLCIPPDIRKGGNTDPAVYTEAVKLCVDRRAMLIVDPPVEWSDLAKTGRISDIHSTDPELGVNGTDARNAAVYFPRVIEEDLEMHGQKDVFPVSGMIAGVMAATDVSRGVWKAPAGQDAGLLGIQALEVKLNDDENGILNPVGINCLRNFPIIGPVVWGARTLRGADQLSDDYKYVPVRRLTLFIEESLYRGTKWAVFEPNDETLWSSLRLSVGAFLADLQRQGAFYNYKVVCDSSTTTPDDIAKGIVNILVQIAPVKPAEFVVIKIQQTAAKPAA